MNKKPILIFLSALVIFFLTFTLALASPGSKFKNNRAQAAQGLKMAFDRSITVNRVKGDISPFTQIDSWGPGNGIWLHGGTVNPGQYTGCMDFMGAQVLSAGWTTDDINTPIGNALDGHEQCVAAFPSLTTFGLIILSVLIVVSFIWMMKRRKMASV